MLTVRTDTEDLARKHRFAIPVARRMGEHLLASPFMQPYERLPPQLRRCQHSTGPHCQQSTNAVGQQSTSADCPASEIRHAVKVRRRLVRTVRTPNSSTQKKENPGELAGASSFLTVV